MRCSTAALSPFNSSSVFFMEATVSSSSMLSPPTMVIFPGVVVTGTEKMSPGSMPYYDPSVKIPADYHSSLPLTQSLM